MTEASSGNYLVERAAIIHARYRGNTKNLQTGRVTVDRQKKLVGGVAEEWIYGLEAV
jgi:hypothetical protein